jgi:DNA invertase Pin-like site-specific DNA recombinase
MAWTTNPDAARERGPRYAVTGTIRGGEFDAEFADTAARAEEIAEKMREDGRRNVRLHLPQESDFWTIASEFKRARDQLAAATELARAAAHRMTDLGISEAETARQLGVDRMTVRSWLGKR